MPFQSFHQLNSAARDVHQPIRAGAFLMSKVRQLIAKIGNACRRLYRDFKLLAETDDAFDRAARMSRDPYDPSA